MRSQVFLFDLGGVLVDYAGPEELFLLLDGRFSLTRVRELWPESPSLREFETGNISAAEFSTDFVAEWEIQIDPKLFLRKFSSWARAPYPGSLSLLRKLRKSMTLACLTNMNAAYWSKVRDDMGFGDVLDRCYASHELGMIKPDHEIFEFVLEDLQCLPDQVTFFDDTRKNVDAASALGMKAYEVRGVSELQAAIKSFEAVDAS